MKSLDRPTKVVALVLLLVFGLVVFHAPFTVFFGQFLDQDILKAWKELLLVAVSLLTLFVVVKSGYLKVFGKDLLLQLIAAYFLLHLFLLAFFSTAPYQKLAGLAIDLRYLLFFVLVFCVVAIAPTLRQAFIKVAAFASGLSLGFAALQATLLPDDILKNIGYSKSTISPYLTVDKNNDFIRINGTFRGPNPLGAYAVIFLSLLSVFVIKKKKIFMKYKIQISVLAMVALIAIWASYSRSALLALAISMFTIFMVVFARKLKAQYWLYFLAVAFVLVLSIFSLSSTDFVQNVVLHNNPNGGSSVDSNDNHLNSVQDGINRVVLQPFGAGVGSTGSASLRSDEPNIIENQYLFIAHESGWLGLGLFIVIFELILWRLYQSRRDWLSLGVFASGIGLALIGLFLPVWADDTVSLVWFGLAAVALGSHYKVRNKNA
ncbi:MAG: O-antigen ligase family protein [Patescibacteria group bacterium]